MISQSGRSLHLAYLQVFEKSPPYRDIVLEVREKMKKYEKDNPNISFHYGGLAYINEELKKTSDRDLIVVFPIVFVVLVSILFYFFRSVLAVALPFALVALSISTTFGVQGWMGLTFSSIISALPAILIAIGIADSIHILITYRHGILFNGLSPKEAAKFSLTKNFIPTILTTITTSIGFFSL